MLQFTRQSADVRIAMGDTHIRSRFGLRYTVHTLVEILGGPYEKIK